MLQVLKLDSDGTKAYVELKGQTSRKRSKYTKLRKFNELC